MFARLWHHSFICRNDEHCEIDPARAREHRPHEILMSGNVDYPDSADAIQLERSKTKVDRDAASFFFGKPVGIDASERANERCLSMVDVACRSEDHAALQVPCSHTSYARSSRAPPRCS